MVTVKRKINNETERYGGYSEIEVKTPSDSHANDSYMEAQQKRAEQNVVFTDPPRIVQNNVTDRVVKPRQNDTIASAPTPDQFMPTIRQNVHKEEVEETHYVAKRKMDSRTKLLLGVYLSVIVILSALVIATGIILSSTGAQVDALEDELSVKMAVVNDQQDRIEYLNDENSLTGRAYNSGMERVENPEEIELLPMHDVPTYEGSTNWFDSFCDWLSGVFGG